MTLFLLFNFLETLALIHLTYQKYGSTRMPIYTLHRDEGRKRDCLMLRRRSKRVDVTERTRNSVARTAAAGTFGRRLGDERSEGVRGTLDRGSGSELSVQGDEERPHPPRFIDRVTPLASALANFPPYLRSSVTLFLRRVFFPRCTERWSAYVTIAFGQETQFQTRSKITRQMMALTKFIAKRMCRTRYFILVFFSNYKRKDA